MHGKQEHDQHTKATKKVELSVEAAEASERSTVIEQAHMHAMHHVTFGGKNIYKNDEEEVSSSVSHADD